MICQGVISEMNFRESDEAKLHLISNKLWNSWNKFASCNKSALDNNAENMEIYIQTTKKYEKYASQNNSVLYSRGTNMHSVYDNAGY